MTDPPEPRAAESVTVRISPRTVLMVVAVVGVVFLLFRIPRFWLIALTAVVLATAIDEPVSAMQRRGVARPLGVIAIYLVLLGLLAVAVVALVPVIAGDARALERDLPIYADQIEQAANRYFPAASGQLSLSELEQTARGNAGGLAVRLTEVGVESGRMAIYVFVTLVVAFFLAVDPDVVRSHLARFVPAAHRPRVSRVVRNVHDRVGAWARGQLLIAVIFGALMGVGLRLLGVPYAWSLGVVAGALEIVPYVGGVITVLLAGLGAATVGLPQVVGVIVLYAVLVNIESHVLAPLLYGRTLGLPPVVILLALLAGVELLGILGALLAIPVTIIAWAIIDELAPAAQ